MSNMKRFLIIALMVTLTITLVIVGRARAQEVGMPVFMTGFLCKTEKGVQTFLDKMEPDLDAAEANRRAAGTTCSFTQKAGIVSSVGKTYTNVRGDTFAIIGVAVEGTVGYTFHLVKTAEPT
jgi:hypothetical protein